MQIRTFLAKDMKEALTAMRAEMGEEAIIVASETLKDGTVLLRAGIEEAQALARAAEEALKRDSTLETSSVISRFAAFEARYRENLLARLRSSQPSSATRSTGFDPRMLMQILVTNRTPENIARSLVDDAERSGLDDMTLALASALDKSMQVDPFDIGKRGALLLIGPPGAGKTAVAAKLAAQNSLAGCPVVLAQTDVDTAGHWARLESFAGVIKARAVRAGTPNVLADAIQQTRASNGLLLADTAGWDPREPLPRDVLPFLSMGTMEPVGVVSAATDAEEAGEIAAALVKLGAGRLIVTGLDLTRRRGSLLAIALSGATIAQITGSPYLADGLETLTPMTLARMVTGRAPPEEDHAGGIPEVA
jgi:flagellar biosynthesis protein FlhF